MPLRYYLFAAALSGLAVLYGCKKVIPVDLHDTEPRIVIEGEVTNLQEPYQVRVSKTVNFSDDNQFPPVSGAIVHITDSSAGKTYPLSEVSDGLYTTSAFVGKPHHSYYLSVLAEDKLYQASSTMPEHVNADSITFALNTDFSGKKDINAIINFQDPPGRGNYYQFIEYRNGYLIPNTFVFEDRLSDGRYIEEPLFNDSTYLHKGDTLILKFYCIDKPTYDYFYTLGQVLGNNTFQAASPANPITNISNGALGYFSAHTSRMESIIVY